MIPDRDDIHPPTRPEPAYDDLELRVPIVPVNRIYDDPPPRRSWLGLVLIVELALVLGAIALGFVIAASRSAPDPTTPPPGASGGDVVLDGALSAQASASTSGPELSGAPPAEPSAGRDTGGAPMPEVATTSMTSGTASWYDDGPGLYAAVHSWSFGDEPYTVRVCREDAKNTCVLATVRDHMDSTDKAIDLGPDAFVALWPGIDAETALWTYGTVEVVVETGMPDMTLPPTDGAP